MSGRAVVVDATHTLSRGFMSTSADRTDDAGRPTNALFVVVRALRTAIAFKEPSVAVAVVDAEADPSALPPVLRGQHERLPGILERHGVTVVTAPRAIEVVASYTEVALSEGEDVVVVGCDKRLAQLVSERVWWYDAVKDVRYTPESVRKRFDVPPEQVAGWLALVGDDDRLPGVTGIGRKGATSLVETFGSVEAAIERAAEVEGRTGKALRAALDEATRELRRATLDRRVALPVALEALAYRAPEPAELQACYAELRFLELLAGGDGDAAIEVELCDDRARIRAALAAFDAGRPISIEALTDDPSPVRGPLVGLALAQLGGRACYVPADLPGWGEELGPLLADPARPKIGHDVKAAAVALARRGLSLRGVHADSGCASHLHQPSNLAPQDLEILARQILRRPIEDADAVRGIGARRKAWKRVAPDRAARYAGGRAEAAAAVWERLEPTTDRALLDEYLALSDTLVGMELRGIAVDRAELERAGVEFDRINAELEVDIQRLAGHELNINSTKQLGTVLYEELGLPVLSRTKTGWSVANEALLPIAHAHPIVPLVIRWRMLRRLRDSWVTALAAAIDPDGRVRSTFHPARSFSGRLVNSQPDLGRVPGKTEEMALIRRAFRAPPGTTILSLDYDQLGLYVLAHLTGDPALVEPLSRADDMHTLTAAAVLELPVAAVGERERQIGKVVNFATFAGQGASALAQQLGVTAQEAKTLIARFDQRYAVVRAFQDRQLELAQTRGYIVTLAGRRWPIGGLRSADQTERSYAERLARRATHEGSVADVSRRSLLLADRALRAAGLRAAPLLQVHDEVLFEVPEEELAEAARVAAAAMRGAYELTVPLRVGCYAGPSWAELERLS